MKRSRSILLDLLPVVAVIVSSVPFIILGFPDGHDSIFGLVRVAEFKSSLVNGQLPPYWGNNLYGGYGSPIFLFYAPVYLFVSTICSVLARSIAGGMILAVIIFSLVAVFGAKLMLQEALGEHTFDTRAASRVAAYFFILNPYLLGDIFLRNAFSEYAALCISPSAVYGLLSIRHRPLVGGLILATSLALIILAHNITALVITPLTLATAFVLYPLPGSQSSWRMVISNIGLGLGLAAFFWIPAIYYVPLVRSDLLVAGFGDFHKNFQSLGYFFGHYEFFSTGLLTPLVIMFVACSLLFARKKTELPSRNLLVFAFACSLLFLFLQTRASARIWATVPYMPYFQFPWRMMGPLALVTSILAGLSFAHLCRGKPRKIIVFRELLFLLLCVLDAIPHLNAARPLPNQILGELSFILNPENIKNFALSATYSDEYLPRFADPNGWRSERPKVGPIIRAIPPVEVKVVEDTGTKVILETNTEIPARLQLGRWFFPGWTCTLNGEVHELQSTSIGSLELSVPASLNRIVLELRPPLLRRMTLWVSLVSLGGWFVMLLLTLRKKNMGSGL